jgi:hypothetical protein
MSVGPINPQQQSDPRPHTPLGRVVTVAEELAQQSAARHAAREAEHAARLAEHQAELDRLAREMQAGSNAVQAIAQQPQQPPAPAQAGVVDAVLSEIQHLMRPGVLGAIRDSLNARFGHLPLDAARSMVFQSLNDPQVAAAVFEPPAPPPPPPQPGTAEAIHGYMAGTAQANAGRGLQRLQPGERLGPPPQHYLAPPPAPQAPGIGWVAGALPYQGDRPQDRAASDFRRAVETFADRARFNPAARW